MSLSIVQNQSEPENNYLKMAVGKLVANVFAAIIETVHTAIETSDHNPEEYEIRAYPFELSRVDGQPVERDVLLAIFSALQRKTTRLP